MTSGVVVTGLGWVTPLGSGREEVWQSLLSGRSGVRPITRFDASALPSRIAGEVDLADLRAAGNRRLERFTAFALQASRRAVEDAQLELGTTDKDRVGVVIGTAYGGISRIEEESVRANAGDVVPPQVSMSAAPTAAAATVAIDLGVTGAVECPSAACASGAAAVARGAELIGSGRLDVVLAGGTDAAICKLPMAAFCSARALSSRNDEPETASRPFDRARDGFVFGEGSAVLVLERSDHARRRRANVLAALVGVGHSSDAYHLGAPHPEGAGAVQSMRAALRDAEASPNAVGYLNAHAASTPSGDLAEARAIRQVFGKNPPPVSATKSMTGHLLGAAGAFEAAVTVLSLADQFLPPTINMVEPDSECEFDFVLDKGRAAEMNLVLTNSFGLGGINYSLVFSLTNTHR